jgi:V8-like Glu-specific endopeptidase
MPEPAKLLRRLFVPFLVPILGCATAQAPAPQPVPVATGEQASDAVAPAQRALTPPDAALRAADGIALRGTELGTMWTFENAPLDYWQRTYGFRPTQEWLDRVRLSSVKIRGCSASFVSEDGLILTNHHCARSCVASNSTPETDHVETGFYASTREEEKICPGAYADVLVGIADVTSRVRDTQKRGMSTAEIAEATDQAVRLITEECEQTPGNVCRVVPLFKGGQYQLYTYDRHEPVKLVMAPELQSGFFGGDHDNFVYPRYALDFAFLRAYEEDGRTPISSPYHFPIDATGPDDGELVFITGNPGSTARMITLAQLMYEASYRHPMRADVYDAMRTQLHAQLEVAEGQQMIQLRERLFGVENTLKKYRGEIAGLQDSLLVATKVAWEKEFRQKAAVTPDAKPYLDVWDRLYDIQLRKLALDPVMTLGNPGLIRSEHLAFASGIIEYHRNAGLPDDERPRQLRGSGLAQLAQTLTRPVQDEQLSHEAVAAYFELAARWLPPRHPLLDHFAAAGESAAEGADRLCAESRILDPTFRRHLVTGGMAAVRASTDPVVKLVLALDSTVRAIQPEYAALLAEESVQNERLARALFAAYGTQLPPDATSSLRISDGVVRGYTYNSTIAPPRTVFHGMFARAAEFDGEEPFNLPPRFAARKDFIDMNAPIDFVTTNDITGGNSGSPLIDREARIVGLAFDGNVGQLPNEYVFRTETGGRTVAVHTAGILEALRSIYQAQELLNELLGSR